MASSRVTGARRAFDVSWFIPALVRYRHILRDVLIASFFLQILGLISPLFFQVVIDKVLVHKGLTTLEILAVGLLVVSIFDVAISGLRTYLFAHTTSRVDVELGSRLFSTQAGGPPVVDNNFTLPVVLDLDGDGARAGFPCRVRRELRD